MSKLCKLNIEIRFDIKGNTDNLLSNKHFEKFYNTLCDKLTEIDNMVDVDIDLESFEVE